MKRFFSAIFGLSILISSMVSVRAEANPGTDYAMPGFYSAQSAMVFTVDGNVWDFSHSSAKSGDYLVLFSDNGTPDNISDDVIFGLYPLDFLDVFKLMDAIPSIQFIKLN